MPIEQVDVVKAANEYDPAGAPGFSPVGVEPSVALGFVPSRQHSVTDNRATKKHRVINILTVGSNNKLVY